MSDEKQIVKPISMNRIRKLKALCRKATPAPWKDIRHSIQSEDGYEIGRTYRVESQKDTICHLDSYLGYSENERADAAFIATARQAAPDLLAEVERLRAENKKLEKAANWLANMLASYEGCPHETWLEAFNRDAIPRIHRCKEWEGKDEILECSGDGRLCWVEAAMKVTSEK